MPHGSVTDTIDPAQNSNIFENLVNYSVCNTLTEVDADGRVQPCLAQSWESSGDARHWLFTLRSGVEFHSGRGLQPADVIASINHHRGDKSTSSVKPVTEQIDSIVPVGDRQVSFTLTRGNADFPYAIGMYNFGIFPAGADGSLDWRSADGTGGYLLKEFQPGVRARLERNPNYWRSDRAHFDSAEVLAIYDSAARINALRDGSVDCISQVEVKIVDKLARVPGIAIKETSGPLHYSFAMNTRAAPFSDNDVRLALKYAVDREDLLRKILRGHGHVGNDQPIGPSYKFYAADIPQRSYDPDRARFHLRKAGFSALHLQLNTSDGAYVGAVDAATLLREYMAPAGITVDVVRASSDTYYSNVWMKRPWVTSWWGGAPTVDSMFSMAYARDVAWNDSFWVNDPFNALLQRARAELDEAKRAQMYREMQLMVRDEGGEIIPLFPNNVFAASTRLRHGKIANVYDLDGCQIIERWWYA